MDNMVNFQQVNNKLACAGQPTAAELLQLAALGYRVIINLGLLNTQYSLTDEAALVDNAGMEYHHIPVVFDDPKFSQLATFIRLMAAQGEKKVLVHCALNYRASSFTGLHLFATGELDADAAQQFIEQVWQPDDNWQQFIDESIEFIEQQMP